MRELRSTLALAVVVALVACSPEPKASPDLSPEAESELAAIDQRLRSINGNDFGDPDASDGAASQLWNAQVDLVRWTTQNEASDSIWGNACETNCWAQWWMCVAHCESDHQFRPFAHNLEAGELAGETTGRVAFLANDGLNHDPDSNDACWKACDKEQDRCLNTCDIATTLPD